MQVNIDKRFIEIFNGMWKTEITWDQFRAAYEVRRSERPAKRMPPMIEHNLTEEMVEHIMGLR